MSYGRIAAALGVSRSLVAKELHRPATVPIHGENGAGAAGGGLVEDGAGLVPPAVLRGDPELQQAQRALAQERLELARLRLRADRLTEDRRLQLLENPGQGGNAMAMLMDSQLRQLRDDISRLSQRQLAPPPPPTPQPSLVDQLSQFRQVSETMQAFAPSRPPSTAVELEMKTALERLNMEDRERMRRLDIDERERLEHAAGERARGEAIARLIEGTAPLLAQAIQKFLDGPAAGGAAAARPLVLSDPVTGPCPSCGATLRLSPEPGQVDRCPRCQQLLAVVDGQIRPPLQAPPPGQGQAETEKRYAS